MLYQVTPSPSIVDPVKGSRPTKVTLPVFSHPRSLLPLSNFTERHTDTMFFVFFRTWGSSLLRQACSNCGRKSHPMKVFFGFVHV
jgi:hypothetical protein